MNGDSAHGKHVVLIVDDDPACRESLDRIVSSLGYETVRAENGIEALALAGVQHIDAILLDIVMKDIDGIEVLKRLKKNINFKHIPVVMITGNDNNDKTVECMKLGAENFLVKPIDKEKLQDLLPRILHTEKKKKTKPKSSFFNMSLSMSGARVQFGLAVTMISVLPTLALAYILMNPYIEFSFSDEISKLFLAVCLMLILLGYGLLVKYPINVIRLRRYLELLAKGSAPEAVHLLKDENDLEAIELYIAEIIQQTEARIRTIKEQSRQLLEAERKQVMVESLATACHHLGQPATVLCSYLSIMESKETDPDMKSMITECQSSAKSMMEVFDKMQSMAIYDTEEYIEKEKNNLPGNTMIKLN